MVHTFELIYNFTEKDLKRLSGLKDKATDKDLAVFINGISFTILYNKRRQFYCDSETPWFMDIHVDAIAIVGKTNIQETDTPKIYENINRLLNVVSDGAIIDDLVLKRIDYCYNAVIENQPEMDALFKIYHKLSDRSCYMTKDCRYATSYYYKSKSRMINVYDKVKERINKGMVVEPYEEKIIRYEARVLPAHLYYQQKKRGLARNLYNYFSESMYFQYMSQMVVKTYHIGDYYNGYHAKAIISSTDLIKEKDKSDIVDFILSISKYRSLSRAIKLIGSSKATRYLKYLQELNVNPVLIPKNIGITYIQNPLNKLVKLRT